MSLYRNFNPKENPILTNKSDTAWEFAFLNMLHDCLLDGSDRVDRTGTGTRSIFGPSISINLKACMPVVTSKKMGIKSIIAELLWFIEGSSDERRLAELTHGTRDESKTTIWTDNLNAPYWKDKAKFPGDLGRIYGVQWRDWKKPDGTSVDQLGEIIQTLRTNPFSRRMVMSAWNPGEFDQMALPPCHMSCQFFVRETPDGKRHLSCQMYQRSADGGLGVPYNITSYAVLTHMIAKVVGMEVDRLEMRFGDFHIYSNHFDQVIEQLGNIPFAPPKLVINGNATELSQFKVSDFVLEGYKSHGTIKMPMAV